MEGVRFVPLGERPDLIRTTVGWHLAEFEPGGDAGIWLAARSEEARTGGIPSAWIAFVDDLPVGSVSLTVRNMDTHPELTPWLAALYVHASFRGRGIGTALIRRCEDEARSAGADRTYLHTERARARELYRRLGWAVRSSEFYEGEPVWVMERDLGGEHLPSTRSADLHDHAGMGGYDGAPTAPDLPGTPTTGGCLPRDDHRPRLPARQRSAVPRPAAPAGVEPRGDGAGPWCLHE